MRILLIEDDPAISASMQALLDRESFAVHAVDLGGDGIDLAKAGDYDIILLDMTLPDMNGLTVIRRLRDARIGTPIMILSGDAGLETRTRALGAGADDYLIKPFHASEMLARIRAVVRRSRAHARSRIVTGKIAVDLDEKVAEANGARIALTAKEYGTLEALSLRKGSVLTKDALMSQLYGGLDEPEQKIVDVFICKLRKKIAAATGGDNYIRTVWGHGYALQDPAAAA
ncbi:MAG TPA: response regulator transcription factor [Rhizomicrobium sp.]|nr:response regulator transcription factor [Rhizomicrobium sp.]